jgi:hypothetical protein
MGAHPPSEDGYPSKRARHSPRDDLSPEQLGYPAPEHPLPPEVTPRKGGQSSAFRNVSACNRCRFRKNRCDQRLPSCMSCEKAGVKCVSQDPITKKEIPRSYVYYLESRVSHLEKLLDTHHIAYPPADALLPEHDPITRRMPSEDGPTNNGQEIKDSPPHPLGEPLQTKEQQWPPPNDEADRMSKLASGLAKQAASDPRHLGSTTGISFARVVYAAVKSSVSTSNSEKGSTKPSQSKPLAAQAAGTKGTSMRDSFFGLHTKPTINQAPFPDKELGLRLVDFYFEHANPQVPILHRPLFMKMFEAAYREREEERVRGPRELYMLNIVFAIGSGIFLGEGQGQQQHQQSPVEERPEGKRLKVERGGEGGRQCQPEEYHASAIVHLESCLSYPSSDRPDGFGGGLEELQAVLLLAGFALLRPVAPGLWYIVGVAVRLAVDLGLHYEDGKDIDIGLETRSAEDSSATDGGGVSRRQSSAKERGRREWIRDFRRRLWWCTYSFDRLVSTCVGRPFGITDQVVTTEFPDCRGDEYITPEGFLDPPGGELEPSYKRVAYHYFRLRLLQSEILQVLQFRQAKLVRAAAAGVEKGRGERWMHSELPSPFLSRFEGGFREWRANIDRRLWEWKESAPSRAETGVQFHVQFLELNYWQAVILLYRQSLSTPEVFEGEYNTSDEVESPSGRVVELREDEERVFLKVAEAGQKVLRLYRQLHRVHLVNYTFLATHHLFMAGISFLYAIWHSPLVRSRLVSPLKPWDKAQKLISPQTMDEVDTTILQATSVLGDLIEKCPPAEACRDAFNRMSKATVQMCMSANSGFGSNAGGLSSRPHHPSKPDDADYFRAPPAGQFATPHSRSQMRSHSSENDRQQSALARHKFDMGLQDLLTSQPSDEAADRRHTSEFSSQRSFSGSNNEGRPIKAEHGGSRASTFNLPSDQLHSPHDYTAFSPTQAQATSSTSVNIDPSLLPSPHTQQMQPFMPPRPPLYTQPSYSADLEYPTMSMDFLQGPPMRGEWAMEGGQPGGLDMGFGLGWEGVDHDFSEGGGLDLMDGFWFGGTGGY